MSCQLPCTQSPSASIISVIFIYYRTETISQRSNILCIFFPWCFAYVIHTLTQYSEYKSYKCSESSQVIDPIPGLNTPTTLGECIFTITLSYVPFLHVTELQEMSWPVVLVIIFPWCPKPDPILHTGRVLHSHEVIVPWTIIGDLEGGEKGGK